MVRFDSDLKPYVRLSNQVVEPYLMGILIQKMQMNLAIEVIYYRNPRIFSHRSVHAITDDFIDFGSPRSTKPLPFSYL